MPAYDYRCDSCSHVFEKTQRITEPSGATCPACAGTTCVRIITGGTFHLKGSGWYASDYGGRKSAPDTASTASASAAAGCGATADGGCSKPACAAAEA